MNITVIGLDIAKLTFHLVGLDHAVGWFGSCRKTAVKKEAKPHQATCLLCQSDTV